MTDTTFTGKEAVSLATNGQKIICALGDADINCLNVLHNSLNNESNNSFLNKITEKSEVKNTQTNRRK